MRRLILSNFILQIKIPGVREKELMPIAYPVQGHPVINIICGENNTGKSFILKSLSSFLRKKELRSPSEFKPKDVVLLNEEQPKILYFGRTWREKIKVGTIDVSNENYVLPADIPAYKQVVSEFLFEQLIGHVQLLPDATLERWLSNKDLRLSMIAQLETENKLYQCSRADSTIQLIERYLSGILYFRKPTENQLEFVLLNHHNVIVPFLEWSEGQQTLFFLLLLIDKIRPDILLVDEIENNLHPKYITDLLLTIKGLVPQTVLTTHHPHVIFSRLVDKVIYIEVKHQEQKAHKVLSYDTKLQWQDPPHRVVKTLDDDFSKITAIYKLFHQEDQLLLKQATFISSETDLLFYNALMKIFSIDILEAANKFFPDRQTQTVLNALKSLSKGQGATPIRIIDFGAGFGRLLQEIKKTNVGATGTMPEWICWEPFEAVRKSLKKNVESLGLNVIVPDQLSHIENSSCDVSIIGNVLHELNPDQAAELLYNVQEKLKDDGEIIVLEVFPLLHAEKYAVPYEATILTELFNSIGYFSAYSSFPVRDTTAYCLTARRNLGETKRNIDEIRTKILDIWAKLENKASSSYSFRRTINNYEDYRSVIQDLTTLASIAAYRNKHWR